MLSMSRAEGCGESSGRLGDGIGAPGKKKKRRSDVFVSIVLRRQQPGTHVTKNNSLQLLKLFSSC